MNTPSMLDLNDIAMFVQVVRYGSFAEACRRTRSAGASSSSNRSWVRG